MIYVSLVLNILVLVPVVSVLLLGRGHGAPTARAQRPWGDRTPARDILLSIYLSILIVSTALLIAVMTVGPTLVIATAAAALFLVQIVYKVLTAVTVSSALRNPVVLSNLGITVVHAITVATLAPAILG
jgi:hypothetical protein